jgi:peptide deformylase
MAILPIIVAPDPRLKVVSRPVDKVDAAVARLMDDMLETMYDAPGIGLAAPQTGVPTRVIVVDIALKDKGEAPKPLKMANPQLVATSEELKPWDEGCLSLPEHYAEVTRPSRAAVRYLDENNKRCEIEADGVLAVCLQHEMDHLDGILFVDHVTALKRNMILRKLRKAKKLGTLAAE